MVTGLMYSVAVFLISSLQPQARLVSMEVGVNGLTCSQCSRSVEMSLRRLDFVENVTMNLEQTSGKITVRDGWPVRLDGISQAVVNAGFSVRYVTVSLDFPEGAMNGSCFEFNGVSCQLMERVAKPVTGVVTLKLVSSKTMPAREWKKIQKDLKPECAAGKDQLVFALVE